MKRSLFAALCLVACATAARAQDCAENPTAPGCPPVASCERDRADVCEATRLAAEACGFAVDAFVCRHWYTQGDYTYCLEGEVQGRVFTVAVFLGVQR